MPIADEPLTPEERVRACVQPLLPHVAMRRPGMGAALDEVERLVLAALRDACADAARRERQRCVAAVEAHARAASSAGDRETAHCIRLILVTIADDSAE